MVTGRTSHLPFSLAIGVGVFVGLAVFTFYYAEGTSYLSSDPKACVNCHVMREHYDGWQKASHHAVATCVDCHLPDALIPKLWAKSVNGYRHSKAFTLQDFPEPIRIHEGNARILNANCVRCHGALVGEILHEAREAKNGAGSGERFDCVRCHQAVGHGPTR